MNISSNWLALQSKTKKDTSKPKVAKDTDAKVKKPIKKTTSKKSVLKGSDGKSVTNNGPSKIKKQAAKEPKKQPRSLLDIVKLAKPSKTSLANTNSKTTTRKSFGEIIQWAQDHDVNLEQIQNVIKESTEAGSRLCLVDDTLKNNSKKHDIGKYISMDCEFVGVGEDGQESALARVSIVNYFGHVILDEYVKPAEKVTDFRTWVSGITPHHLKDAISFKEAQQRVSDILKNRILVGHAVHHDLESLFLSHPKSDIRDTSKHLPYRQLSKGKTPSLKKLAKEVLNIDIQGAQHSSVEDSRATMLLYRLQRKEFEKVHRK